VPSPPFNLAYPGTGAWQTNSAYIQQYQSALTYLAWKYNQPTWNPGGIDGVYGPNTAAAVSAFETGNGLTVDGEAGPAVAAALQASIATAQASGALFPGYVEDHMGAGLAYNFSPGYVEDHMGSQFAGRGNDHMGGCAWKAAGSAPDSLRAAITASCSAMSHDAEIPYGVSTHSVNGVLVRVYKHNPTGQTTAVSYCST
jgi:hypothetical protein